MRTNPTIKYALPLIVGVLTLALFQLALHNPADARLFAALETGHIPGPQEFNGIYTLLLAYVLNVFSDAALTMRVLSALAAVATTAFTFRLFKDTASPAPLFVITNISFLYFAMHSPASMVMLAWFAAVLWTLVRRAQFKLEIAGILAALGLGIDPLLASALIVYVTARALVEPGHHKGRVLASTGLGIVAYLLFAYMLHGGEGFATALGSGYRDMFSQVNPINFGVGLLITFNLLLWWVFRSPSITTSTKYLGSLLIVLFLFVRVEPQHLLVLLVVALTYLETTGTMPKQKWVLPVYALANVAAFFLLPSVAPLEARYNVRVEKPGEAELFYSDYFARHLPSFPALKAKAAHFDGVTDFYARNRSSQPIILDPATETSFDAAALRRLSMQHPIGGYRPIPRRFQSAFSEDTSMIRMLRSSPAANYVATTALPRPIDSALRAWRSPRVNAAGLTIYAIDSSRYQEFFDAYIFNHYLSYH